MNKAATRGREYSTSSPVLYLAFEHGGVGWQLGFATGLGQRARRRRIPARDLTRLETELDAARGRFGLAGSVPVVSCYEAGRDGFWLHRYLGSIGVENVVVASAPRVHARDVAAAGGWKTTATLKRAYQQADPETMLEVVLHPAKLRGTGR